MTDFAALLQPDRGQSARTVYLVDKQSVAEWRNAQSAERGSLIDAARFDGKTAHQFLILPGEDDGFDVVSAVADIANRTPWCLARLAEVLPEGTYRLAHGQVGLAALGWMLGQHRFSRYKAATDTRGERVLLTAAPASTDRLVAEAEATALVRDLVDTPAVDMGPAELEEEALEVAKPYRAEVKVTQGDELAAHYPMIAAVGAGAVRERAPRLIELHWGDQRHPRIAIVGKGVCFDTGGLDIKPASGMRLMKKDMGGAAHALGLASIIMKSTLR